MQRGVDCSHTLKVLLSPDIGRSGGTGRSKGVPDNKFNGVPNALGWRLGCSKFCASTQRESRQKDAMGCVRLAGRVKEPDCWKRSARSSPDGNQDRVAVRPGRSQIKTVWCSLTLQPLSWNQAMALRDTQEPAPPTSQKLEFSAAEIGALAHLYRGEVYRALPGGRALTAPRTGRWLRRALRCLRLSAVRKPRPYRWCSLV